MTNSDDATPLLAGTAAAPGAYREGEFLVVRRRGTTLPPGCVLCNAPEAGRVRITVRRFNVSFLLRVLLFWLFGFPLIIFFLLAPKARIEAGLCADHLRQNRSQRRMKMFLGLLALSFFAVPFFIPQPRDMLIMELAAAGLFALLAMGLLVLTDSGVLRGRYAKRNWMWVRGASAEYLLKIPQLAGGDA